jgi:hypothetical protein
LDIFFDIINKKYVNIVSYKKSGKPISTPVLIIQNNNCGVIRTFSNSGKSKRINNNSEVKLSHCTISGKILGNEINAIAKILDSDNIKLMKKIEDLFNNKYKWYKIDILAFSISRMLQYWINSIFNKESNNKIIFIEIKKKDVK